MDDVRKGWLILAATAQIVCAVAGGRVFDVGPEQTLTAIGDVPWEALHAGDTVRIHWRQEPYREKWVVCATGAAASPVTVSGVPGPDGQLPVINGQDATCRRELDFWGEDRAVIKIGGANVPADCVPVHIVIENLEIRSARPPHMFVGRDGQTAYRENAAAIWVEKGEHITIRSCRFHDCANGFVSSRQSSDLLVEQCEIYGNGTELGIYQHNVYTESVGIVFQFNYFRPLRSYAFGNNLKDRSSGTVVRWNWIEGGNRLLDLVDSDYRHIYERDDYRETFVYGNVLIKRSETTNNQLCHYGGDSGKTDHYRNGTIYFCNNTVVSHRLGQMTLWHLSSADDRAVARNNIFWCSTGLGYIQPLLPPGRASFGSNWCPRGFEAMLRVVNEEAGVYTVTPQIFGSAPGFRDAASQDFRLAPGSLCVDRSEALPRAMLAAGHTLATEYVPHRRHRTRPVDARLDIGAFELAPDQGKPGTADNDPRLRKN
ncbi:MAG: polysaccharide-degrading enzyme [Lentisphaerae bacterium]|jgi:hypothetical protein|nr:polysaccharide-degrading enzyme [Lentisphaerota bacterium]MBT5607037.1 polysaccharide-degrading enzyme [Lentisphaerota bacterium]MBT7055791.1 polysaccharide-degrading enzyme [Lentisphaerota bacterium]